jgi:hypothetical protein
VSRSTVVRRRKSTKTSALLRPEAALPFPWYMKDELNEHAERNSPDGPNGCAAE